MWAQEKDCTDARGELAKERAKVDEVRMTSERKLSELRTALRKAEEELTEMRTDKIRLEADVKTASDKASLLERQLEQAEARFRDALAYQQRAVEVAASPGRGMGGGALPSSGEGNGGEEVALMSSRLVTLESENASLQKQLQEVKQHRDNWKTMATDHEAQLRTLRDDLEARGANAQQERQKLEALLAEKTLQLSASEEAAQKRQSKMGDVERELNALKDNVNIREGTLQANISQLELERDGLKVCVCVSVCVCCGTSVRKLT